MHCSFLSCSCLTRCTYLTPCVKLRVHLYLSIATMLTAHICHAGSYLPCQVLFSTPAESCLPHLLLLTPPVIICHTRYSLGQLLYNYLFTEKSYIDYCVVPACNLVTCVTPPSRLYSGVHSDIKIAPRVYSRSTVFKCTIKVVLTQGHIGIHV